MCNAPRHQTKQNSANRHRQHGLSNRYCGGILGALAIAGTEILTNKGSGSRCKCVAGQKRKRLDEDPDAVRGPGGGPALRP